MSARDANLTEENLADLDSLELDLGPGPGAPPAPSATPAPSLDTSGPSMLEMAPVAPPAQAPFAQAGEPPPGLGPDPFLLGPEPYPAPAAPAPKPSVRDIANRVAEGGARAAAQLSPILQDARAKTAETTARAVDEAKSRGYVPLAAILVAVGVLVVIVFVVARMFMPDGVPSAPSSGEPRTKHTAESSGATQE